MKYLKSLLIILLVAVAATSVRAQSRAFGVPNLLKYDNKLFHFGFLIGYNSSDFLIYSQAGLNDLKTKEYKMTKEIKDLKSKEVNSNDQLNIIKNDKKELDQKIEEMKLQINDLRAFDIRIIKNLNEFEEVFKPLRPPRC